ncbi:MAG: bifunctional diaminohydroxyphosphoribosylaminopyrimidine deaminase/5-amino-6-(5-phosphoribosylamino)uracil reductase RibD [Pseudomonadota bacterium]
MQMNVDLHFMSRAFDLASQGRYTTTPNPCVGCVIVSDGQVIGEGFHRKAGEAHAEIAALQAATDTVAGTDVYVTLEPCSHHGRTGPCVEALIEAKVARVVIGNEDPNPKVAGQQQLKEAGIEVVTGLFAERGEALNRGFFKRQRTGRPFVKIKLGTSLDFSAALANGDSQWITGAAARGDVQRLRAESCAIISGVGTVIADDPRFTVRAQRLEMAGRQPTRVILDHHLRTPVQSKLLAESGATIIYTTSSDANKIDALSNSGALVETLGELDDLDALLKALGRREMNEVMIEAGPTLAGAAIEQAVFDELIVYLAPKILGRGSRAAAQVSGIEQLPEKNPLALVDVTQFDEDVRLTYIPAKN